MIRNICLAAAAAALLAGCGPPGTVNEEAIQTKAPDPIAEARATLTNYANGMPVTSEASSFPQLVERVRAVDPGKADILDKGLKDIMANKRNPAPKAKELLKKL